jgi:hypothetical protein
VDLFWLGSTSKCRTATAAKSRFEKVGRTAASTDHVHFDILKARCDVAADFVSLMRTIIKLRGCLVFL